MRPEEVAQALVGKWQKTTNASCEAAYPDRLEFRKEGIYFGSKGKPGDHFLLWDSGSYQVVAETQLRISTANDAQITYEMRLSRDKLTFKDAARCVFSYQRQ